MIVVQSRDLPPPIPNPQPQPTEQVHHNMTQPYQQQPGALPPQAPPYPQAPQQGAPQVPWAQPQQQAPQQAWQPPPAPQAQAPQQQTPVWVPPPGYGDPNAQHTAPPSAQQPQFTPPPAPAPEAPAPEQPKRRGRKPKDVTAVSQGPITEVTESLPGETEDDYSIAIVSEGEDDFLQNLRRLTAHADALGFKLSWSLFPKDA